MIENTQEIFGSDDMNSTEPLLPTLSQTRVTPKSRPIDEEVFVQSKRILIVDDDLAISDMLGALLKDWGFEVVQASNGREGLQLFESHSIDGILLDLEMPVMDGWTMLDELRWQNQEVPVVVMSGGVSAESLRNVLREGAQGFLTKPFQFDELKQKCFEQFSKRFKKGKPGEALVA